MKKSGEGQRALLLRVARSAMVERGLEPDIPEAAMAEARALTPPDGRIEGVRDLRSLAWCSIDNDDSRDLDQLTVAVPMSDGGVRILVAIADVSASVAPDSALDAHAQANTTSVYTPARVFPMLPERLSTDLTSLNPGVDRLAIVMETVVGRTVAGDAVAADKIARAAVAGGLVADGTASGGSPAGGPTVWDGSSVYPAWVHNQAQLTYSSVGAWLEGRSEMPPEIAAVPGLADNLRLQDTMAQALMEARHEQGALELETIEVRAHFAGDTVSDLEAEERNRAKQIIEDFMIASNGTIARYLASRRFPVLRRVVRSPERWQRIADLAEDLGEELPDSPDARELHDFLVRRRAADPLRFPDLSLSIIKLLGRGQYVATFPGDDVTGHFGLAVRNYTHSTAPNRRYPDLITQRLIKAALAGRAVPYDREELVTLATRCTRKEDDVNKVERLVEKAAAACMMSDRIGHEFDGLVTGAGPKGTWVRIFQPPVEGRVEHGASGLDVGDRVRVRLESVDPERGYIDFARVGHSPVGRRRR